MSDPASLRAALRGCDGAFGVTNYWEHFEREFDHGRNFVDALTASGIQHAVISTLPHAKLLSGGRLGVPHLDTKGRIEEYARGANLPATYVHVAFYYENFLTHFPPRRQPDGTYVFGFPQGSTPLAAVAAEDVGGVVAAIFAESFWYRDKVVGVVGDDLRCDEYAEDHASRARPSVRRIDTSRTMRSRRSAFPARAISPTCSSSTGSTCRTGASISRSRASCTREIRRSSAGCAATCRRSSARSAS